MYTCLVAEISKDVFVLENDCLKVKIEGGAITSLIDRASGREIVAEGKKANQLVIMDDKPLYWQAWDVRNRLYIPGPESALTCCRSKFFTSRHAKNSPPATLKSLRPDR